MDAIVILLIWLCLMIVRRTIALVSGSRGGPLYARRINAKLVWNTGSLRSIVVETRSVIGLGVWSVKVVIACTRRYRLSSVGPLTSQVF